jgi:hypothetical protein
MIALVSGQAVNIDVVFSSEYLMERDKKEYEDLLVYVDDYEAKVKYWVRIEGLLKYKAENPAYTSLILVDESDIPMLETPEEFKTLVADSPCICFSATPAITDMEIKIEAQLGFRSYSYSFGDDAVIDKSTALMIDVDYTAATLDDKARHIKELAKLSPVLVYCDADLTKAITDAGIPSVMIAGKVDY